jgi:exosortase
VKAAVKVKMQREISESQSLPPLAGEACALSDNSTPAAEIARSWATVSRSRWLAAGSFLGIAFIWSYWPTLRMLEDIWRNVQDYSHGYFVIPLAIIILWARRDRLPSPSAGLAWPGLILVALSVAMRYAGAKYYLESLDGWSIMPWVLGVTWFFFGRAVALWSLPSILFLTFMVRIPFRAELTLSLQLQLISTKLGCWGLQLLGQPALSEGNLIYLADLPPLEVAGVCSGMRIFIGIFALAYAFVVIMRRTWWETAILLASVIPIALISNATRVMATGLLWRYISGDAAHRFSHDIAGYAMIVYAALLFALVLWYLGKVVRDVEMVELDSVVRSQGD